MAAQNADPPYENLLLQKPITITGKVVNQQGQPLAGVRVDYTANGTQPNASPTETASDGGFRAKTTSPAIVFRLPGYASERLFVKDAGSPIVTLKDSSRHLSRCPPQTKCTFSASLFCFSNLTNMKVHSGRDIDYAAVSLMPKKAGKGNGITYGQGAFWSSGILADRDVWISETLREDVFAAESLWIIDARGSKKGGRFWREFGAVTESAYYKDVNEQRASILDNVIDSACLNRP